MHKDFLIFFCLKEYECDIPGIDHMIMFEIQIERRGPSCVSLIILKLCLLQFSKSPHGSSRAPTLSVLYQIQITEALCLQI